MTGDFAPKRWDWESIYPAPAKLNLFLHVVGRRADGYHRLQTLFRFIDHGDRLSFSPGKTDEVVLVNPQPGIPPENDLTVRAAHLLQSKTGCRKGVEIRLEKTLPMGGGLGGGSSDAATVMLALNCLWQLNLSRQALQDISLSLGADVPVFIFGRNAFAEGVGEALQAIDFPPTWYVVLEPPVQLSTAVIFGAPELKRDTLPIRAADWQSALWQNDLQSVAISRFPVIGDYLGWLSTFGRAAMTGSGACVFAAFEQKESAEAVIKALPNGMQGWVAQGLGQHPLYAL